MYCELNSSIILSVCTPGLGKWVPGNPLGAPKGWVMGVGEMCLKFPCSGDFFNSKTQEEMGNLYNIAIKK